MSTMSTDPATVRLERTIGAPPARVYRAWLDPEVLARWMSGDDKHVSRAEVDERVGGAYRIWQAGDDGEAGGFEAEILELVRDERISLLWRFVGPDRAFDTAHDSVLTITFAPVQDGVATALTLVHERLAPIYAAMPAVAGKVGAGWNGALDKLERALA